MYQSDDYLQGFTAVLRDEYPRLVRLCRALTRDADAAEDLVQETLVEAWRNRHKLWDMNGLRPWLAFYWACALLLKGGTGAGIVGFSVGLSSLLVRDSPADVRGRVLALYEVSSAGAVLLGQLAASFLGDSVGVVALLSLQNVLYTVAGAITLLVLPRSPA